MQVEIDALAGVKKHLRAHKEAYVTGLLGFALGLLCRRPIVIQNIIQR